LALQWLHFTLTEEHHCNSALHLRVVTRHSGKQSAALPLQGHEHCGNKLHVQAVGGEARDCQRN
jgi:hypothetical protein